METREFLTVREIARRKILSERHLRQMREEGRLPGVQVGSRFLVNLQLLIAQLDEESMLSVKS